MRKLAAVATGTALLGAALVAPTAAQGPTTELTVSATVTPNKAGTKKDPQGVKLRVKAHWETTAGFEKPVVTKAIAFFPKGSLYNGVRYPKCNQAALDRNGPTACPKGSKMGSGGGVAYADTVLTRPKITVFNGGGKKVCLYTVLNNPARVQACVPGKVQKTSGKWAYKLTLTVPQALRIVAGVPIALRDFDVTAGREDWLATTSCPRSRRWPFQVETFYSTGGSDVFKDSVTCRR